MDQQRPHPSDTAELLRLVALVERHRIALQRRRWAEATALVGFFSLCAGLVSVVVTLDVSSNDISWVALTALPALLPAVGVLAYRYVSRERFRQHELRHALAEQLTALQIGDQTAEQDRLPLWGTARSEASDVLANVLAETDLADKKLWER